MNFLPSLEIPLDRGTTTAISVYIEDLWWGFSCLVISSDEATNHRLQRFPVITIDRIWLCSLPTFVAHIAVFLPLPAMIFIK